MKIYCHILLYVDTLSEDPTIYLTPPPSIFLVEDEPVALYFIFASNGGTAELVANVPTEVVEDDVNLRVTINDGITKSVVVRLLAGFLDGDGNPVTYVPFIAQTTNVTLIGK